MSMRIITPPIKVGDEVWLRRPMFGCSKVVVKKCEGKWYVVEGGEGAVGSRFYVNSSQIQRR